MTRDTERQRTYDAETYALSDTIYYLPQGLPVLEAAARRLAAHPRVPLYGAPRLRHARPDAQRSYAYLSSRTISFAYGHDSLAVLCHEMAHLITPGMHDEHFRAAEVELLRLAAGSPAADRLSQAFLNAGLSVATRDQLDPPHPEGLCADLLVVPDVDDVPHARRISRLLAKAASTTPEEAEALKSKALELSSRYGISAARLSALGHVDEVTEHLVRVTPGPYAGVRTNLLSAIARAHQCRLVWYNDRDGRLISVIGHASDVVRVRTLFSGLDHQAMLEVMRVPTSGNALRYRVSWLSGFVSAVADSMRATRESQIAADPDPTGLELVLAGRRSQVDDYMSRVHPRLRSTGSAASRSVGAYSAGRRRGAQIVVSGPALSSRRAISA